MAGWTDAELGIGGGTQRPPSSGFTDEELGLRGPETSVTQLPREATTGFIQGAKETLGTNIQGVAETVLREDEGNAYRQRAGMLMAPKLLGGQGLSWEEANRIAQQELAEGKLVPRKPTETLTHQVGTAIQDVGKTALGPQPGWEDSWTRKIASGFGSIGSNIAMGLTPGVRAAAPALIPFSGAGEAAQRARQAGASEEQVAQAAHMGLLPGATDLIDLALTRTGIGGHSAAVARRALHRLVVGGLLEGSQEGIQQFLQNMIAKGIYKPNQDLSEDVLENIFVGAIVGGGTNVVMGRQSTAQREAQEMAELQRLARITQGGVATDATIGAPPPGAPPPSAGVPAGPDTGVPPPSGPQDYGLPTEPSPPTRTVTPEQPTGTAMGVISDLQKPDIGTRVVSSRTIVDNGRTYRVDRDNRGRETSTLISDVQTPQPIPSMFPEPGPTAAAPGPVQAPASPPGEGMSDPRVLAYLSEPPQFQRLGDIVPRQQTVRPDLSDVRAAPTAADPSLIRKLGISMYGDPEDMSRVAVKEMFQNSFDAIKGVIDHDPNFQGNIDIDVDEQSRTVKFTDDGSGIPLEVLRKPFFSPGGTHKTTSRPSGGWGIAKLAFMFPSENLRVVTMGKDGVVLETVTNGERLQNFLNNNVQSDAPIIKRRLPTGADKLMFPKGHGSHIEVTLPSEFLDPQTQQMKPIPIDAYDFNHESLGSSWGGAGSPLFRNINVRFNKRELPLGNKFPVKDFVPALAIKAKWGTVRVIRSKERIQDPYRNGTVLSNGLFQFKTDIKDLNNNNIPYRFYFDIEPKVGTGEPGYPFSLNRQQYSDAITKDIVQIHGYLALQYQMENLKSSFANYGDMQYMDIQPDGSVKMSPKTKLSVSAPLPTTAFDSIGLGNEVTVADGELTFKGTKMPDLDLKKLKDFTVDVKALKIDQDKFDTSKPVFHGNVDVVVSQLETKPIEEMGREKFGPAFDQYMAEMGSHFLQLRNVVSDLMHKHFPDPTFGGERKYARPYSELSKDLVGISIDTGYRGVSTVLPMRSEMINVGLPERMDDPVYAGVGMVGTMIHELAHFQERNEKVGHGPFAREMQAITYVLEADPSFSYQAFKQRVVKTVAQNWEIQKWLHGVLTNGTFDVRSRDKRLSDEQLPRGIGSNAPSVAPGSSGGLPQPSVYQRSPDGVGPGSAFEGLRGLYEEATDANTKPEQRDVFGSQQRNASAVQRDSDIANAEQVSDPGIGAAIAVPSQPEFDIAREQLDNLFQATRTTSGPATTPGGAGTAAVTGTPTSVRAAAGHADRMNRFYKYMAGLDQLLKSNPNFAPLRKYFNFVVRMHNDESRIQDAALRTLKMWRRLGDEAQRLNDFIDDLANMRYRTPAEVARDVVRNPTPAEVNAFRIQHRITSDGMAVYAEIQRQFSDFLGLVENNAIAAAQRIISDPIALAQKENEIRAEIASMRAKPYFPLMRFGLYYVMKKNSANQVIHFETFDADYHWQTLQRQKSGFRRLNATKAPGETVTMGKLPESVSPFVGLPPALLQSIKTQLSLTPTQIAALEQIQLLNSPALNFKSMMKSNKIPGYSKDFQRAYAKYFFHGGRYFARTRWSYSLNDVIKEAQEVPDNKANEIAQYMRDHLQNTILDAKGDFGIFKAGIFIWALGYMPAAATMNMLQTPTVTWSHLSGKFGPPGIGAARATKAILKAAADVRSYYKRQTYDSMSQFQFEALAYGIKTGRVSETQAAELAALMNGGNLLGVGGNKPQRMWNGFLEKGSFLFEMAEQFNRRVAFRAALDLATKYPNSAAVKEAVQLYDAEYRDLQNAAGTRRAFSPAEAAAIITAVHTVDQTQFIYARYGRPRFMRGRVPGTLFVFKSYLQHMLFWLGQNKKDALPHYLLAMALLGGSSGLPGYDDLRDLIRAFAKWWFGKDYNLDKETRALVISLFGDKVPPDLVLHGLARVGFGIPALLDLMGSWITGVPGRGLSTEISHMPSDPTGRGQNVPAPVLDRHRALSMGNLLGFSIGDLLRPQNDRDLDHTMNEQIQKASGAVFGLGFNVYRALVDQRSPADLKRWERAAPRALGALSRSYRAYSEGRERGRGGIESSPTILPYDVRDTEQMMEVIFMALGYQTLRQQSRWDNILAKADAEKFYQGQRQGLFAQYDEALSGGNAEELERVRTAIVKFNEELPDFARQQTITAADVRSSIQQRQRVRNLREEGLPTQRRNIGISHEIDRLYREGAVDVRPIR